MVKTCITCKKEMPSECFGVNKSNKDGYRGECKECIALRNKRYYKLVRFGTEEEREQYFRGDKMLDERQLRVCQLLSIGTSIIDIAEEIGISRQTVYDWKKQDEMKARLEELGQELILSTKRAVVGYGPYAVAMLKDLAENAESEKVRLEAICKLLDKVISNAVKIELSNGNDDQDSISQDLLNEELNEFDNA